MNNNLLSDIPDSGVEALAVLEDIKSEGNFRAVSAITNVGQGLNVRGNSPPYVQWIYRSSK